MKKPSDDLFSLVKSLTPSEKGYFKKYASAHNNTGEINYLKLYDIMNVSEAYNEEEIKRIYAEEKFVNHLWVTKKYLYDTILSSLQEYHSGKQTESELNDIYNKLQVLHSKGLFDQCSKMLHKAKEICNSQGLFHFLIKFLSYEKKLLHSQLYSEKNEADIDRHHQEILDTTEKIKNLYEYQYHSAKLFLIIKKKGSIKNVEDLVELKSIMNMQLFQNEDNALTTESKIAFYKTHFFYDYLCGNFEKCIEHSSKLIAIFEKTLSKLKNRPISYLKLLNNHLGVLINAKDVSEFDIYLAKIRKYCKTSGDTQQTDLIVSYDTELKYFLYTCQYQKIFDSIDFIEDLIDKHPSKSNHITRLSIRYKIAYAYFICRDYDKCLNYLNKIANERDIKDDVPELFYARLLMLLTHYEMGNVLLLEYIVKSTFRYFAKAERIYKFEKIIYDYIKRAFRASDEKALRGSFAELRGKLLEILKDPFEKAAFSYIDLVSWLESKIKHKHFQEILEDKASKGLILKRTNKKSLQLSV